MAKEIKLADPMISQMNKKHSKDSFQEYGLCIMFHLFLPLLPVFLETWITGTVSSHSLLLCTAIYSIAIGNSSNSKLLFGFTILISIIFAVSFGIVAAGNDPLTYGRESAMFTIAFLFCMSLIEKYRTYITEGKLFWNH